MKKIIRLAAAALAFGLSFSVASAATFNGEFWDADVNLGNLGSADAIIAAVPRPRHSNLPASTTQAAPAGRSAPAQRSTPSLARMQPACRAAALQRSQDRFSGSPVC